MVSPLGQPGCSLVRLTSLSRDGDSVARGDGGRAGPATSGQGRRKDQTGGNEPTILARCSYSALRGRRRPTVRRPRSALQRPYPLITPRSCFRSRRACTCRGRRRGAERGLRHADPGLRRPAVRSARRQYGRSEASPVITRGENPPGNTWRIRHFASCFRHCRIASWIRERPAGPGYSSRPHPPRGPPAPPSHHNGSSSTQDPANPRHPYPKSP
jgi:hypothetical protein